MAPWLLMQGSGSLDVDITEGTDYGTKMSVDRLLASCFDPTNSGLNCVDAGTAGETNGTTMNVEQVWKNVFDPTNTAIRIVFV